MDQRLDELLQRCTVKLKVPDKVGWGSGFFIAPGLILTCAHVVKGMNLGDKVQVSSQEQISFPDTTLVQLIPDYDLALLRFSPSPTVNFPCVYLAPDFEPFDRFYTFGYSDQFPNGASVTSDCEGTAFEQGKELILFKSGQIRPGISGSALLNWATGKVCGIVKFTRDRTTDLGGGAIPTQVILEQFPQIKELQQQFHQQDDRWVKSLKVPTEEIWREACRNWIKVRRSPVTNLFADILGKPLDLDEIHVPLGLLERQRKPIAPKDVSPEAGSQVYRPEQIDLSQEASVNSRIPANQRERQETITPISYDDFFRRVLAQRQSPKSQGKRLAIIGEAGAGKTVQLLKIADWVLNATEDLPIWISLEALGEKSLREYVFDIWLPAATARLKQYSSQWENDLEQRLKNGKIWLLLDGADEMRGANPLGRLTEELKDLLFVGSRVVLSCRVNLWDAAGSAPLEFDTYKMLDFSYGEGPQPDQVKQFIEKWFTAIDHLEWGDSLRMALDELGKERIKNLARNPLRLGLLCFNWQEKQGNLPETKAMLYQQFVESLYLISEQTKGIALTPKQQSILNKALGRLAKQAIDRGFKSILPHNLVCQELVESQPVNLGFDVFDLVLKLGWLNRVGMEAENPLHNVYAFFHPSFQEYFAALAIDDWDFFLPRNHKNQPVPGEQYRVFEPQWREVILLWLGRSDVEKGKKEQLIRSLVKFQDGCKGFYSDRAFLLAAAGIAEFKDCTQADAIVHQLMQWRFFASNLLKRVRATFSIPKGRVRSGWAETAFSNTDSQRVIRELVRLLETPQEEYTYLIAAENLGTFDPGNETAIRALMRLLESTQDQNTRRRAAETLGTLDPGNETVIRALMRLLRHPFRTDEAYQLMMKCAEALPYPAFYQAFHAS
ncbi:MAG TPA: trypsin-like peptidase domain-containing protein [Synechococcales cyanobacterium M55_K2018_004]|nr:trypsin-like peptidase domain-containing protein [Synechococcales cyanobacterium M55_K2018_004]